MKYYVGFQPSKELGMYYRDLVGAISRRFKLDALSEKRRIPHVTLKSPFQIDAPNCLNYVMESFCEDQKPSRLTVCGFKCFDDNVIYLNVNPSNEAVDTLRDFLIKLKSIEGMTFGKHDRESKKWHITLAKGEELGGKFEEIYRYLGGEQRVFDLKFNSLTTFRKDQERTFVDTKHFFLKR